MKHFIIVFRYFERSKEKEGTSLVVQWLRTHLPIQAEKAMASHSSTLAWKIPWMEEPGRLQSMGSLRSDTTEQLLHFHFSLSCIGKGNGNPLQCSCLENSRDGGAWWTAIYGVAQSWTRLKRCSSSSQFRGQGLILDPGRFHMPLGCRALGYN